MYFIHQGRHIYINEVIMNIVSYLTGTTLLDYTASITHPPDRRKPIKNRKKFTIFGPHRLHQESSFLLHFNLIIKLIWIFQLCLFITLELTTCSFMPIKFAHLCLLTLLIIFLKYFHYYPLKFLESFLSRFLITKYLSFLYCAC